MHSQYVNQRELDTGELDTGGRDRGMALFIVLLVVVVLTILISQLVITTKIEEQVAHNNRGYLEMSYTLQATVRSTLHKVYEDWSNDIEDGAGSGDPTGGGGGAGDIAPPPVTPGAGATAATFDSRHEEFMRLHREQLNDVNIELRMNDGEGRLSLNDLFRYVTTEDPDDPLNPTQVGGVPPTTPPIPPTPSDPTAPPTDDPDDDEEVEEYILPSTERIELTKEMVSRLVQHVIDHNRQIGFDYEETPVADVVAAQIVDWVLDRVSDEATRRIRSMKEMRQLPAMTSELWNGPRDPEEVAREADPDAEFAEDPFENFMDGFGGESIPGFLEDPDLGETGGVVSEPRALGIRHVFTAYTTGKLNMNTVSPEVLMALLFELEFELAREIVLRIDDHLNSYPPEEEEEDDAAATETDDATDTGTESKTFNVFKAFTDISAIDVDEEWQVPIAGTDKSPWDHMKAAWEPFAVFKSTFFTAEMHAERDQRKLDAEVVILRRNNKVTVLAWRELTQ
ncbi:MAG: hypothetical protein ACKVX7_11565 [Planctomycetota bacterium]